MLHISVIYRYTLSEYYIMLSWISIPAIGREYYWEPSCWHPRSGMTRQVREIRGKRFFFCQTEISRVVVTGIDSDKCRC